MQPVKPMRAAEATDKEIEVLLKEFRYMIASPKLDGIRCMIQNGTTLTKSLKLVPNLHIRKILGNPLLDGLDGELILGSPTAPDVYRQTVSAVMRIKEKPNITFWVFDDCLKSDVYYMRRPRWNMDHLSVKILEHKPIYSLADMKIYEEHCLTEGYEGIVLRDPTAMYKHGKSTAKQGGSIKVKRFTDAEAIIIGFEEQMHNANEAKTNELGRTQRSSHKENKIPMGTLGAFICQKFNSDIKFNVGTMKGVDAALRQEYWNDRENLLGKMIKYKSFKVGEKDAPRHPVFLGMRDPSDM